LRPETFHRYQIMLRAQRLAALIRFLSLPEDVSLSADIDAADLA
jgi:hypothetical protein